LFEDEVGFELFMEEEDRVSTPREEGDLANQDFLLVFFPLSEPDIVDKASVLSVAFVIILALELRFPFPPVGVLLPFKLLEDFLDCLANTLGSTGTGGK